MLHLNDIESYLSPGTGGDFEHFKEDTSKSGVSRTVQNSNPFCPSLKAILPYSLKLSFWIYLEGMKLKLIGDECLRKYVECDYD